MPEPQAPNVEALQASAASRQSFREARMAQLSAERAAEPPPGEPPAAEAPLDPQGLPPEELESAVPQDQASEGYVDEEEVAALEDSPPAPEDDGTPDGEAQETAEPEVDWKQRYADLQSETQSIRESRSEMDQEHAEAMSSILQLRFQLEDDVGEAKQMAEFFYNTMTNNARQFENIDWSQVPPDKVQEVQAQAQQAMLLKQNAEQAFERAKSHEQEVKKRVKQREAEIAKTRLRRTIPSWSGETYDGLRTFAMSKGMAREAFNDITDPVVIEALHAYQQLSSPAKKVQTRTTRKAPTPRGKAARRQARDERGKFATKQVEPNVRGSFADKHRHRLAMERQGRG